MKPLLVGEDNPFGSRPELALFPLPEGCAGHRLQKILGLTRLQYLRRFERLNLCRGKWDAEYASWHAFQILNSRIVDGKPRAVIMLGRKVSRAFSAAGLHALEPFTSTQLGTQRFVALPHPSGRCRAWNEPGAAERARALVEREVERMRTWRPPELPVLRADEP